MWGNTSILIHINAWKEREMWCNTKLRCDTMSSVIIPHFMVRFPKASGIRLETSTSTTTTEKQKQRTKSILARIAASLISSSTKHHSTQQCSSHCNNNKKQPLTDPVYALPYDIFCLVLEHLTLRDLLCCLNVSTLWSECIVQWPHLWKRLVEELPAFDRTFANAVLRDTAVTTFRLTGPAKSDMTEGLLQLLRYAGTRCERLSKFYNVVDISQLTCAIY